MYRSGSSILYSCILESIGSLYSSILNRQVRTPVYARCFDKLLDSDYVVHEQDISKQRG